MRWTKHSPVENEPVDILITWLNLTSASFWRTGWLCTPVWCTGSWLISFPPCRHQVATQGFEENQFKKVQTPRIVDSSGVEVTEAVDGVTEKDVGGTETGVGDTEAGVYDAEIGVDDSEEGTETGVEAARVVDFEINDPEGGRHLVAEQETRQQHYVCESCGKRFSQSSNMKRHVKSLHKPKLIKCFHVFCTMLFLDKSTMKIHAKNCFLTCNWDQCFQKFTRILKFDSHNKAHRHRLKRLLLWFFRY